MKADQNMSYASEHIATSLKVARKNKGLSQRELSARSGVPQSHISKIENNAVDLRLSSLSALAHALDLELAIIPRKAAPAVKSITRSSNSHRTSSSNDALRELARVQRALDTIPIDLHESSAVHALQKQLEEMNKFRNILQETDALRKIRNTLEAIKGVGGMDAIERAVKEAQNLRNMLAHNVHTHRTESPRSKPAYQLDEEDNDG